MRVAATGLGPEPALWPDAVLEAGSSGNAFGATLERTIIEAARGGDPTAGSEASSDGAPEEEGEGQEGSAAQAELGAAVLASAGPPKEAPPESAALLGAAEDAGGGPAPSGAEPSAAATEESASAPAPAGASGGTAREGGAGRAPGAVAVGSPPTETAPPAGAASPPVGVPADPSGGSASGESSRESGRTSTDAPERAGESPASAGTRETSPTPPATEPGAEDPRAPRGARGSSDQAVSAPSGEGAPAPRRDVRERKSADQTTAPGRAIAAEPSEDRADAGPRATGEGVATDERSARGARPAPDEASARGESSGAGERNAHADSAVLEEGNARAGGSPSDQRNGPADGFGAGGRERPGERAAVRTPPTPPATHERTAAAGEPPPADAEPTTPRAIVRGTASPEAAPAAGATEIASRSRAADAAAVLAILRGERGAARGGRGEPRRAAELRETGSPAAAGATEAPAPHRDVAASGAREIDLAARAALTEGDGGGAGALRSDAGPDAALEGVTPATTAEPPPARPTVAASVLPGSRTGLPTWAERIGELARLEHLPARAEMRIELEPAGLGHLEVRLRVEGGNLHAAIVAEHEHARSLLVQQRHLLEAALQRSDLRLSQLDVDVRGDGDRRHAGPSPDRPDERAAGASSEGREELGRAQPELAAPLRLGRLSVRA